MKTPFYVGTVVRAYREAIDDFYADPQLYESKKEKYMEELCKTSHREFTTGFYFGRPEDGQFYESNTYIRTYDFVGMVMDYDEETQIAVVEQRNKFKVGDVVEVMNYEDRGDFSQTIKLMLNEEGESVDEAPHPQQILRIKMDKPVQKYCMLRKKADD